MDPYEEYLSEIVRSTRTGGQVDGAFARAPLADGRNNRALGAQQAINSTDAGEFACALLHLESLARQVDGIALGVLHKLLGPQPCDQGEVESEAEQTGSSHMIAPALRRLQRIGRRLESAREALEILNKSI